MRCRQVRLDDERGVRTIGFATATADRDGFTLSAAADPAHRIELRATKDGSVWHFDLVDRIASRAQLSEVSLVWELSQTPRAVLAPNTERGVLRDTRFRTPTTGLRFPEGTVTIAPDLAQLEVDRRMPWFQAIEARRPTLRIRLGLLAETTLPLRDDTLRFSFDVLADDGRDLLEPSRRLVGRSWTENAAQQIREGAAPIPNGRTVSDERFALLEDLVEAFRDGRFPGEQQGLEDLLAAAHILAAPTNFPDRQIGLAIAENIVGDATAEGLFPYALDAGGQEIRNRSGIQSPTQRYDGAVSARIARRLLLLRGAIPGNENAILEVVQKTARTLTAAQQEDGRIPDRFLATNGAPEGRAAGLSSSTATAALLADLKRALGTLPTELESAALGLVETIVAECRAGKPIVERLVDSIESPVGVGRPAWDASTNSALIETEPLLEALAAVIEFGTDEQLELVTARARALGRSFTPPTDPAPLLGAAGRYWGDPIDDPAATAGLAWVLGRSAQRRFVRDLWATASACYRAALFIEPGVGRTPGEPDWLAGRVRAASHLERCRTEFGDLFLDASRLTAASFDAAWVESLRLDAENGVLEFDLRSDRPLRPLDIRVQREESPSPLNVVFRGQTLSTTIGTRTSFEALPVPVPATRLIRPGALRHGSAWLPEATGPWTSPNERCRLVGSFESGRSFDIELRPDLPGHWTAAGPLSIPDDASLTALSCELFVADGDTERSTGSFTIPLADYARIDPAQNVAGDPDSTVRVVHFADGRRLAARIRRGDQLSLDFDVNPKAERLELLCDVAGPIRIEAGGSEVHLSGDSDLLPRTVTLELGDRRLWSGGQLSLRFQTEEAAQIASVAWRPRGVLNTALAGEDLAVRAVDRQSEDSRVGSTLRLLVVPTRVPDATGDPSVVDLRRAFFGGSDYRRTPEPQSRATIGSLASLVQTLSGGRTALIGRVTDPVSVPTPSDDPTTLARWWELIEASEAGAELTTANFDAIVVVQGVEDDPGRRRPSSIVNTGSRTPLLWLPERMDDGSFVSTGYLAAQLFANLSEWPVSTDRDGDSQNYLPLDGDLGLLAGGGHAPSAPRAEWLQRLGWIDVVTPDLSGENPTSVLYLSPMLGGRNALLLPGDGIETFHLSIRGAHPGDPNISSPGLAINRAWSGGVLPRLYRLDGRTIDLDSWWMSESRPSIEIAMSQPNDRDLFRSIETLDQESIPPLTTVDGTLPWRLDSMAFLAGSEPSTAENESEIGLGGGRSLSFSIERLRRTLDDLDVSVERRRDPTSTFQFEEPRRTADSLEISLPRNTTSVARVRVVAPATVTGRQRTRFRVRTTSVTSQMRIPALGDREFSVTLEPQWFELDRIAAEAGEIVLEFQSLGQLSDVVIDDWTSTPLAWFESSISDRAEQPVTFADDTTRLARVLRLDGEPTATLQIPLLLQPGSNLLTLRLQSEGQPGLALRVRGLAGGRSQELFTESELEDGKFHRLIVELPPTDSVQTVFLDLSWSRNRDAEAEIRLSDLFVSRCWR